MRIVSRPNYILCLSVSIIRCIMYRFVHDSPAFRSPCHSSSLFADGRPPRWAARPAPPRALHVRGGPPAMVCLLSHSMVLLSGVAVRVPCLRTWTVARSCNNRATVPNQQPQATAQPPPPPMSPLSWDCSPSPIPPPTPPQGQRRGSATGSPLLRRPPWQGVLGRPPSTLHEGVSTFQEQKSAPHLCVLQPIFAQGVSDPTSLGVIEMVFLDD